MRGKESGLRGGTSVSITAGETPTGLESGLWFAYSGQPHQLELPWAGTHLYAFWAVVPGGANVSRESLKRSRELGSPMGTT